jgi:2'-5' RNA ligase
VWLELVDEESPTPDTTGMTEIEAYAFLTGQPLAGVVTAAGPPAGPATDPAAGAGADDVDEEPDGDDDSNVDVADEQAHTGAMIALRPCAVDAQRLVLAGGEALEELHLTLWFLGEAADYDVGTQAQVISIVQSLCVGQQALTLNAFGVAVWNPLGADPCVVLNVGGEGLAAARDELGEALDEVWSACLPGQHEPYSPHVCLAYSAAPATLVADALSRVGPVTFDAVRVAFGASVVDVPLGYSYTNPAALPASGATLEAVTVPYEIRRGGGCPASKPYGVYKKDGGAKFGCHASHADAESQIAAIESSEHSRATTVTLATDSPTVTGDVGGIGQTNLPGMVPPTAPGMAGDGITWEGILVVEGVTTGDGREFAPGSLTWPAPWLPLRWAPEDYGAHDGAVDVGRIDEIFRDPANPAIIRGRGVFNTNDPMGLRAYQNVRDNFLKGISVDVDAVKDADVEYVFPPDIPAEADGDAELGEGDGDDGFVDMLFGPPPDKTIFHAGRVRGATLVSLPAFVEAQIQLAPVGMPPTGGPPTGGPVTVPTKSPAPSGTGDTHPSLAVDTPWDERTVRVRVKTRAAAGAFVHERLGLHHDVFADGRLGPANVTACSVAIGAVMTDPAYGDLAMRRMTYDHLAAHLRTHGLEPQPFSVGALAEGVREALTAGAVAIDADAPPLDFFRNPGLMKPTAPTITADGHYFGHAATWRECHIGSADVCVVAPHEGAHEHYLLGECLTADGTRVAVGTVTLGTGHASTASGVTPQQVIEHYDNTGTAIADVNTGEDEHGIWFSGYVRRGVSAARVIELRAAKLSGDWRRIGGRLRLVALLAVNTPGFGIPRTQARFANGDQLALVAAGVLTADVPDAEGVRQQLAINSMKERLARRIHRDPSSRRAELRARVHRED